MTDKPTTGPALDDLHTLLGTLADAKGEASLMVFRDRDHGWTISLHLLDETDDGSHVSAVAYGTGRTLLDATTIALHDLT